MNVTHPIKPDCWRAGSRFLWQGLDRLIKNAPLAQLVRAKDQYLCQWFDSIMAHKHLK